jgi:hypothetical protein
VQGRPAVRLPELEPPVGLAGLLPARA